MATGTGLEALGTAYNYPIVDGIPVLFDKELAAVYRSSVGTVQEYYRRIPPRYSEEHELSRPGARVFLGLLRDRLKPYVGRTTSVLEVGAGTGFATDVLLGMTDDLVVTDASLEMLLLNRRGHPQAPMVCCTIEKLPFADESFDAVFGNNTFYLVPDKRAGAREVARVLRPGGVCLISEMNPFNPLLPVAFVLRRNLVGRMNYDNTPSRIAQRWGQYGMTLEKVDFYAFGPHFAGDRLLKFLTAFERTVGAWKLVRRFAAVRVLSVIRKH